MIDCIPVIAGWLKDIGRVEIQFPSANSKFPVITVIEIYNSSDVVLNGIERLGSHSYQIDVWDKGTNRKRCEQIAAEVSKTMVAHGLSRSVCQSIEDGSGLHRKIMQFDCKIDEKTLNVYRR